MKRILSVFLAVILLTGIASSVFAEDLPFTDVKEGRWSYDAIKYAYEKEYMNGTGGGKFTPAGTMTRSMVVTVLYRREGAPEVAFSGVFTDVPDGKWYSDAVIWAKDSGVVTGTSADTFTPDGEITREQMAAMFYRYASYLDLNIENDENLSVYADTSKIHDYALEAMRWAVGKGIITGISKDGKVYLDPRGNATREQFATILKRFDETDLSLPLEYNMPKLFTAYTEPVYEAADDADIFVSPDGDDGADGSLEHPYATFERAVEAVKELKKTKTEGGITVAFMEGTYPAPDNVIIDAESSGTAGCPVEYRPYDNGEVLFTAGLSIPASDFKDLTEEEKTLFPESSRDSIKKVDLTAYGLDVTSPGEDVNLFCGTTRMDIARWPNKDTDGTDNFANYVLDETEDQSGMILLANLARRIEKYHDIDNMYMLGYYKEDWKAHDGKIISYDPETKVLTPSSGPGTVYKPQYEMSNIPYFYFYNITEELDRTDEYFIDNDTSTLYVMEPAGEYTFSKTGRMFTVSDASYVTFRGMTFAYGTEHFAYGTGNNIEFNDITVRNMRSMGINLIGSDLKVFGCTFYDVGRKNVAISGGDRTTLTRANNVIENCLFDHFGSIQKTGHPAVYVNGCGIDVRHNEFRHSSNIAIFYSEWIWASNYITVEYNYIDNTVLQTSDSGAIYAGRNIAGHGSVVRYNIIANTGNLSKGHTSIGLYLDDSMSGQEVYGNLFYNNAGYQIFNHDGRENLIHDNILISIDNFNRAEIRLSGDFSMYPNRIDVLETVPFRNELWTGRFPHMAEYVYDRENWEIYRDNIGYVLYPAYNQLYNNYLFTPLSVTGEEVFTDISDDTYKYAVEGRGIEPLIVYNLETNPFFVDPTNGDYTQTGDYKGITIPVKEIGRY